MVVSGHVTYRSRASDFVGREDERQRLQDAVSRSLQKGSTLVLLEGEAGIGKTRLGDVLEASAEGVSSLILRGNCLPGASIPFLPINEIALGLGLPPLTFVEEGEEGQVCPEDADGRRRGSENFSVLFLERLEAAARSRPVLVRIEDMQWCDTASLRMIGLMGTVLSGKGAILCMTLRPEDLANRGREFLESYQEMKEELKRYLDCTLELNLGGLSKRDSNTLIGNLMPEGTDKDLLDRVAESSEGIPLFAVEMARFLLEGGELDKGRDRDFGITMQLPSTVVEVIRRRIDSLPHEQREIIEWAAILGPKVDSHLLQRCSAKDGKKLEGCVHDLIQRYFLLERTGDVLRFSHARVREVVLSSMSMGRAREMHRRAGETMERSPREGDDLLVLSDHFFHGGVPEKASLYALGAGRHLIDHFAALEALNCFQRALDLGVKNGHYLSLWEGIGDCHEELGQYHRAADAYRLSLEKSVELDRVRLLWKLANCYHINNLGNGTWDQALRYLEEAIGRPDLPPYYQGEILSNLAMIRFSEGDMRTAGELSSKAVVLFRECGNLPRQAWEMDNLSNYIGQGDGICRAVLLTYQALDIYEQHPWPRGEALCNFSLSMFSLLQGRYEDALAESASAWQKSIQSQNQWITTYSKVNLSFVWAHIGHKAEAFDELSEGMAYARRYDQPRLLVLCHTIRAWYQEVEGDLKGAEDDIIKAESILAPLPRRKVPYALLALVRGRLEMASGDEGGSLKVRQGLKDMEGEQFAEFYTSRWEEWLGDWYTETRRWEEARTRLQRAAEIYKRVYDFDSCYRTWRKLRDLPS